MLQWLHNDPDVPIGRIIDAHLYWYNNENQTCAIDCMLYYLETNLEHPVSTGLYNVEMSMHMLST